LQTLQACTRELRGCEARCLSRVSAAQQAAR